MYETLLDPIKINRPIWRLTGHERSNGTCKLGIFLSHRANDTVVFKPGLSDSKPNKSTDLSLKIRNKGYCTVRR